jgi:hypothetical protein
VLGKVVIKEMKGVSMNIKEPKLERRKNGKGFFLLDNYNPGREIEHYQS